MSVSADGVTIAFLPLLLLAIQSAMVAVVVGMLRGLHLNDKLFALKSSLFCNTHRCACVGCWKWPSDPTGKSSRFTSAEAELAEDLDLVDVKAQLVVSINGKRYRGAIQHDHDHAAHGKEEDHAGHDR